jgi:hypothetical protein
LINIDNETGSIIENIPVENIVMIGAKEVNGQPQIFFAPSTWGSVIFAFAVS